MAGRRLLSIVSSAFLLLSSCATSLPEVHIRSKMMPQGTIRYVLQEGQVKTTADYMPSVNCFQYIRVFDPGSSVPLREYFDVNCDGELDQFRTTESPNQRGTCIVSTRRRRPDGNWNVQVDSYTLTNQRRTELVYLSKKNYQTSFDSLREKTRNAVEHKR